MSLAGKSVLITGAALRVGRSLALAVAEQGADVVIHFFRSLDAAKRLQIEIQQLGRRAFLIDADLSDPQQVLNLIPRAMQFTQIFTLVNNASIFEQLSLETTTPDDWNRHIQINLTAPFLLSQAFAKSLSAEMSGRIVNILDWRSSRPGADHFPYTISKAGLAALTKSLAVALAPRISVNGLALGAILPPNDEGYNDALIAQVPHRRWGSLEEVNNALIFLLTGPSYMTGEIIHLDGGRHLI